MGTKEKAKKKSRPWRRGRAEAGRAAEVAPHRPPRTEQPRAASRHVGASIRPSQPRRVCRAGAKTHRIRLGVGPCHGGDARCFVSDSASSLPLDTPYET